MKIKRKILVTCLVLSVIAVLIASCATTPTAAPTQVEAQPSAPTEAAASPRHPATKPNRDTNQSRIGRGDWLKRAGRQGWLSNRIRSSWWR